MESPGLSFLAGLYLLALLPASFWGLGRLLVRPRGSDTPSKNPQPEHPFHSWALDSCLGLALVVFIGGVLNCLHFSRTKFLLPLLLPGLFVFLRNAPALLRKLRNPAHLLPFVCLVLPPLLLPWATQLPPPVLNLFDDLHKYLVHPIRMLATGTVQGSPLSAMGSETLGAKAFLDGYVLSVFPVSFINGTDALLGLLLCLGMISHFRPAGFSRWLLLPVILGFYAIPPQYTNSSTLFLGAALISASIALSREEPPRPLARALVYAAMVAMKPSFLLFAFLHIVMLGLIPNGRSTLSRLRASLILASLCGLALLPWLLVHRNLYFSTTTQGAAPIGPEPLETASLWTSSPLYYGGHLLGYSFFFLSLALLAVLPHLGPTTRDNQNSSLLAAALAPLLAYLLTFLVLAPRFGGAASSIRYTIPMLLGAFGPVVLMTWSTSSPGMVRTAKSVLLVFAVLPVVVFSGDFAQRLLWSVSRESVLGFPAAHTPEYQSYGRLLMTSGVPLARALQSKVPPGEPILLYCELPFHFDFGRNPIFEADEAGLTSPWAHFPCARYLIWEKQGPALKSRDTLIKASQTARGRQERLIAAGVLALTSKFETLAAKSTLIDNAGSYFVYKLPSDGDWIGASLFPAVSKAPTR